MSNEFFSGPKGIHFMRQTDSLSFASQYFNYDFNFFEPRLFNLKNMGARAACEFPITYYLAAWIYCFFGKSTAILKLIHLIIIFFGSVYVFKLTKLILENSLISILVALFFYTSTVFNYYSFNYLPDAPALGLTLIGLYFIFKYFTNDKRKSLIVSFIFFTLSGLIKVTYAINPISIIVYSTYKLLFKSKGQTKNYQHKNIILYGGISSILICFWNFYMFHYNSIYNSNSFNTKILPIWNLSKNEILSVWDIIINSWNSEYFNHPSMIVIALMLLIQIIFYKKSNGRLMQINIILFVGCISYFILFYAQFKDHDYYALAFFPLLVLLLINGLKTILYFQSKAMVLICLVYFFLYYIQVRYNYLYSVIFFPLFILVLISRFKPLLNQKVQFLLQTPLVIFFLLLPIVLDGIDYSRRQLERRYNLPISQMSKTSLLIKHHLFEINKLNITENSKFIIAPEISQNGGLFFLDKEGWVINEIKNITVENISKFKKKGANFLLLNDVYNSIDGNEFGETIYKKSDGIKIIKLL